jgi:hypothetical protein
MGRRRNPVLSEYFYRHDKLPDSSNRYEQSCKACGERFPKGRSETLQAHLSKHCRAISPQDRARAIAQLRKAADDGGNYSDASLPAQTGNQKQTAMTALDALAEISSQHLSTRGSASGTNNATPAPQPDRSQQPLSADDFLVSDMKGDGTLENGRAGIYHPRRQGGGSGDVDLTRAQEAPRPMPLSCNSRNPPTRVL